MADIRDDLQRLIELLGGIVPRFATDREARSLGLAQATLIQKRLEAGIYATERRRDVRAVPGRN